MLLRRAALGPGQGGEGKEGPGRARAAFWAHVVARPLADQSAGASAAARAAAFTPPSLCVCSSGAAPSSRPPPASRSTTRPASSSWCARSASRTRRRQEARPAAPSRRRRASASSCKRTLTRSHDQPTDRPQPINHNYVGTDGPVHAYCFCSWLSSPYLPLRRHLRRRLFSLPLPCSRFATTPRPVPPSLFLHPIHPLCIFSHTHAAIGSDWGLLSTPASGASIRAAAFSAVSGRLRRRNDWGKTAEKPMLLAHCSLRRCCCPQPSDVVAAAKCQCQWHL